MTDFSSIEELDRRIAIVRDNIRQLIEQAAARSGAADEALASDRIAQQSEELERLTKERDANGGAAEGLSVTPGAPGSWSFDFNFRKSRALKRMRM